jgi:uncharacterized protein YaiL (DUF2058 family)
MNKSLQDQLLNAGLIDGKKAKKISNENRKTKNEQRRSKDETISEAQAATRKAQQDKLARDTDLNQKRNLEAEKKAIAAQVAQLIKHYRLKRNKGEIEYKFSDGSIIKKILVTPSMSEEIVRGRLCIARLGEAYEIIPKPVADKIRERDTAAIVVYNEKPSAQDPSDTDSDNNFYAQFEIPDDLMW